MQAAVLARMQAGVQLREVLLAFRLMVRGRIQNGRLRLLVQTVAVLVQRRVQRRRGVRRRSVSQLIAT